MDQLIEQLKEQVKEVMMDVFKSAGQDAATERCCCRIGTSRRTDDADRNDMAQYSDDNLYGLCCHNGNDPNDL